MIILENFISAEISVHGFIRPALVSGKGRVAGKAAGGSGSQEGLKAAPGSVSHAAGLVSWLSDTEAGPGPSSRVATSSCLRHLQMLISWHLLLP